MRIRLETRDPFLTIVLAAILAVAGCSGGTQPKQGFDSRRQAESVSERASPASPATEQPSIAEQKLVQQILDGQTADSHDPAFATAVRRIEELGGSFEFDSPGRIVGIDLASGRVTILGADLQHLLAFPHLVRLKIASGDVANADVATIAQLSGLQSLALRNTKIDAQGLRQLSPLMQLRSLDLQRSVNLQDDAFVVLAEFPKLEELVLVEGVFTNDALVHLQRLESLQRLDLRSCSAITADGLKRLEPLRHLQILRIGGAGIDDAALEVVNGLETLTGLTIEDASITDGGLAHLEGLPLEDLSLARCFGITDESFAAIARLSKLNQLYVRDILVSGSGLGRLASLPQLSTLRLRQTGVGDDALEHLASLAALQRLELALCLISDEGLTAIGALPELIQLDVEDNRLSDAGVRHLEGLRALERLSLSKNEAVTDASIETLLRMTKLRELELRGTAISEAGSQQLRKQLPDCRVVR